MLSSLNEKDTISATTTVTTHPSRSLSYLRRRCGQTLRAVLGRASLRAPRKPKSCRSTGHGNEISGPTILEAALGSMSCHSSSNASRELIRWCARNANAVAGPVANGKVSGLPDSGIARHQRLVYPCWQSCTTEPSQPCGRSPGGTFRTSVASCVGHSRREWSYRIQCISVGTTWHIS
jgi:hypothetical protein